MPGLIKSVWKRASMSAVYCPAMPALLTGRFQYCVMESPINTVVVFSGSLKYGAGVGVATSGMVKSTGCDVRAGSKGGEEDEAEKRAAILAVGLCAMLIAVIAVLRSEERHVR